jgi:mono/diheme cytochrome c family protein
MRHRKIWFALLLSIPLAEARLPAADETAREEYFESKIRPVLVQQCVSCHSGERPQAGLNLDYRGGWEVGGKSGPGIVRGDPDKSLVVRALRHQDGVTPMPLGGNKLPPEAIAAFEEWIRTGAFDPRDKPPSAAPPVSKTWEETYNERRTWWSLQPVSRPAIPTVRQKQGPQQAIDSFILAKLEAAGLEPAPPADRVTLLRRLSFVLTGLPPTPEELDAFLADRDPKAYEKLVSRMLTSVHFGEHWARHWMDVVRYSDTYGYESDIPAKGAWRYRDYLIRAFDLDVPFDQLVREQIAGDLLPNPRINPTSQIDESVIGTMFYQMGEKREGDSLQFNGIHQEMLNNKIDAFSKTFQAMTVGCARCHDHKLDAISQHDYYALAGVFMSSRWVANTLDTPERNRVALQRLATLKPKIHDAVAQWWLDSVAEIPKRLEVLIPEKEEPEKNKAENDKLKQDKPKESKKTPMEDPLYIWFELRAAQEKSESVQDRWRQLADRYAAAHKERTQSNARDYVTVADFRSGIPEGWSMDGVGLHQGLVRNGDFAVSLEGSSAIHMLMPAGLFTNSLSPRLNGVVRTPFLNRSGDKKFSIQAAGGDFSTVSEIVDNAFMTERQVYLKTVQPQWTSLYPVGGQSGDMSKTEDEKAEMRICSEVATKASNPNFPPRIGLIRSVGTLEQERDPRSWFGVTRVVEHSSDKPPADELGRFESLFSSDPPVDLAAAAARFEQWARTAIDAWRQDRATEDQVWIINWLIEKNLLPNNMEEREAVRLLVNYYRSIEKQIADPETVNGMADVDPGRDYRLNVRGVYEDLGERVPRGYVKVLASKVSGPPLKNSGRLEVAQLVASPANPLTARVFVNRVWYWIFGAGIVATTDDFGHLGDKPSHPELLDYLASEFVSQGWSIKKLVQSIVLSETFRQSGSISPKAREVDPLNRLLSHYPLRRLEAESIRDSILAVSSRLDRQLFGETIDPPRTKEDPEKRLFSGPLDGNGRRSIYIRMSIMEPPKFLATFNQPSPKVPTGRRDKTNSPAQALALLNDPFVAGQAEFWAKSLIEQSHHDPQERLTVMFRRAFSRNPDAQELTRWRKLARELAAMHYGVSTSSAASGDIMASLDVWKDLAHTMFNAKEFIYVY